jgi:hypothetical protein
VEYFVSYYDYYQPEAYVARSDTYIEKESLDQRTDRPDAPFRDPCAAGTRDVIIVASVSCIYGIGSVETYSGDDLSLLKAGESIERHFRPAPKFVPSCNIAAMTQNFRARARSGCAATMSNFSPPITKTAPGGMSLFRRRDRGYPRI